MKLAIVNATRSWGGVKTWTVDVASFLVARGHAVCAFVRDERFAARLGEVGCDAQAVAFGADFNPALVLRLRGEFRRRGVDTVLVNVAKDLRSGGVAGRLAGVRVVQRIGAQGDLADTLKIRLVDRLTRPAYLTNCLDIRDKLLHKLPFLDQARIAVFYPGKPVADTFCGTQRQPGAPLRLVTTNQLVAGKAMQDLIGALGILVRERAGQAGQARGFVLDVVGDGDQDVALKAQAVEEGIAGSVRWHGFQADVTPFLRAADVFCLPSTHEGVPQGLLEAMAHGLVPVARRVGGIPEVWPPPLERFLVEPDQGPGLLAGALRELLDADDGTLAGYRRAAWERANNDFNRDTQFARLEEWLVGAQI